MAQNNFLSFLNSLDRGANDRNSITEFLANILTPGDNMEYVGGQLLGADGKRPENFGEKTSYGTLGQANFEGNDRVKRGLLSKMTSGMSDMNKINATPPGYGSRRVNMRPDALDMLPNALAADDPVNKMVPGENLFKYEPDPVDNMVPGENLFGYQTDPVGNMVPGENQFQYQTDPVGNMVPGENQFQYDPVGSGRGNGAMEQQSREAQAKFNEFLQLVEPSVVENAMSNPELMEVLRDAFFRTYPNLLKGIGGYN
jgi:hypothetical protein